MHTVGKFLRGLGLLLGVLALSLVAVFAVLQTQLGKTWLAREIGQTLGDPDFTIAMDGLNLMGITAFRRSTNMATGNLSI